MDVRLLARFLLSQADVPTRQAYVVAVVDPSERTAATAYTNTARYVTRPVAPLIAGAALRGALGAPFIIAGALKSVYDIGLYVLFRNVEVEGERVAKPAAGVRTRASVTSMRPSLTSPSSWAHDGAFVESRGCNRGGNVG